MAKTKKIFKKVVKWKNKKGLLFFIIGLIIGVFGWYLMDYIVFWKGVLVLLCGMLIGEICNHNFLPKREVTYEEL